MAGWGTGGHIYPIKSLIEFVDIRKQYGEYIEKLYWFWTKKSLEEKTCHQIQERVDFSYQLQFVPILSWKYRRETYRKSQLKNISDLVLFICWFFQSLYLLVFHRIDVIFCKGGYVALPVILAWALLRKKIIVHESDTHPGLVNRIASRFAKKTFTWFDWVLPHAHTIGQIISDEIIIQTPPTQNSRTQYVVIWWSQGSKRIYQNLLHILEFNKEIQSDNDFYVVLGFLNEEMSTLFDKFPNVHTYGFLSQKEMGVLYNTCDIAITRGGTTSLAEQKLYDLKQIIIPIPWTHDQYDNANWYVRRYNDISINQRDHDFEQQLANAIKYFKGFKKISQQKDKKTIVAHAKEIIRNELLK